MNSSIDDLLAKVRRARQAKQAAVVPSAEPVTPPPLKAEEPRYAYQDDEEYVNVGLGGLLAASEKLLATNRGLEQPDHRDSWAFKRVMYPDRILRERIRMDETGMLKKVLRMAAMRRNLSPVAPFAFDDYALRMFVGGTPLSSPLEETNPMHILENARRLTLMGPGGIGSRDALTADMQAVSPDQFGFIDPVAGPESEMAGIDVRLAWGVRVGSDGRLYQQFRNRRTGELEWVSPDALQGKVVKIPD